VHPKRAHQTTRLPSPFFLITVFERKSLALNMSDPTPNTVSEKEPGTPPLEEPKSQIGETDGGTTDPVKKKRVYKEFGHETERATHAKVNMEEIHLTAADLYDKVCSPISIRYLSSAFLDDSAPCSFFNLLRS
jgi:hypothetical protein